MVSIRTCQKLTEVNIALPEINLYPDILDEPNINLAEKANTDSQILGME